MQNLAKILYDTYKGEIPTQFSNVSKTEREEAIRAELLNALGLEKFEKKAFRRAWRENKNNVFAIIEDVCNQIMENGDYQKDAFFNSFVETRNLALGDTNIYYVEGTNELEFVEFSGSHWDLKRSRVDVGSSFMVEMKDYGIKVYEFYERVTSGRASIDKLVALIAEALNKKLAELSQATFAAALNTIPAVFKTSGSFVLEDVVEIAQHVEASNGQKPVLVGTRNALAKLQGKETIPMSNGMLDEKNAQGYLTLFQGYRCVELAQGHKIGTFEFTMSDNKVYVLSGDEKLVKLTLEGDTEVKEVSDGTTNADRTVEHTVIFKAGAAVAYNKMLGLIELA